MANLSEFTSGADYDAQYADQFEPEITTLTRLAKEQNGAILDIGCGTGIVTIPLAKLGFETVGVDLSEPMLAQAREKAELPNLEFVLGDALEFTLTKTFNLAIMTGNAFQGFLGKAALTRLLKSIHAHLEPGGLFVFDTRLPEGYGLGPTDFELWQTYVDHEAREVRYFGRKAAFNSETNVLSYEMKRVYPDGREVGSSIALSFTPYQELRSLLERSGFEILEVYGSWGLEPFEQGAEKGVFKVRRDKTEKKQRLESLELINAQSERNQALLDAKNISCAELTEDLVAASKKYRKAKLTE